jgi:hypothetical protein
MTKTVIDGSNTAQTAIPKAIIGPAGSNGFIRGNGTTSNGPPAVCVWIYESRHLEGLQCYRLTKILFADGDPATNFAKKLSVLDKGLVLCGIAYLKAEIVQITKVLVVSAVRHICFSHNMCLHYKSDAIGSYSFA